ncbi:hypothetical protein FB566_0870 [Stackebrandtia endophytica]|uniref:Knr4/Smi1-like domain-containing protein n=1 Tax=Stackebrandtia endophytica TaxID=1496996 RepID=A0A543AS09_9ACTN|nr:SMI1/KNR4 family protein [Stackebrandtia endophytica]TQL75369.1 hypothetical protein FB566_0870 [Stackebrandtia endophytica]
MVGLAEFMALVGEPETAPPVADWAAIEAELGLTFPEDYREWARHYTTLELHGFMRIDNFATDPLLKLRTAAIETFDGMRELTAKRGRSDVTDRFGLVGRYMPALPYYPEPGGLLTWGFTNNGDWCMWLTDPDPAKWTIVISDAVEFWQFDGGFLDFLVGICNGSLRCSVLPENFPKRPAIKELKGYEKRRFPGFEQELDTPVLVPTRRWRSYFEQSR